MKRRTYKPKRKFNMRRKRVYRANKDGTYLHTRRFTFQMTIAPTVTSFSGSQAFTFRLSDLPNSTDFTNLYDQYKILGVRGRMNYIGGNVTENAPVPTYQLPAIYYKPDFDDIGVIDINQMLQAGNKCGTFQFGNETRTVKKISIPPYTLNSVRGIDEGGASLGNFMRPLKSPWINTASPNVEHGALKVICRGTPLVEYKFQCDFTAYVLCRHQR